MSAPTLVDAIVSSLSDFLESSSPEDLASLRGVVQSAVDGFASGSTKTTKTTGRGSTKVKSARKTGPSKMNGYHYFVKCTMPSILSVVTEPKNRMTHIGGLWKEVAEAEKLEFKQYSDRHNEYVQAHLQDGLDKKTLESNAVHYALTGTRFVSVIEQAVAVAVEDTASSVSTTSTVVPSTTPTTPVATPTTPVATSTTAPASSGSRRVRK